MKPQNAIADTKNALKDETSRLEDFMRNAPPNIYPEGAKVTRVTSSDGKVHVEMPLPADCVFGIAMHGDELNKIAMAKNDWQNMQKVFKKARFCGIIRYICYGASAVTVVAALITRFSPAFYSFLSAYVPAAFGVVGVVFDIIAERIQKTIPMQFEGMVSVDETVRVLNSTKKEITELLGRIEKALG
ncbi:TPA: hypothetical protein HA238_04860 [Candidatus Micrarchaeota archaeon]|nr:hypothetical protein [Candidatus Micrarchaeota archaeon]